VKAKNPRRDELHWLVRVPTACARRKIRECTDVVLLNEALSIAEGCRRMTTKVILERRIRKLGGGK